MSKLTSHLIGALCWLGLPLLVTLAGLIPGAGDYVSHSALLMLYLIAVLLCSLHTDRRGVLACALFSFIFFNYFHTAPRFSLLMHDVNEFVSAIAFVVFALLAGGVSHKLKSQVDALHRQERFLKMQVALGQDLQDVAEESAVEPLLGPIARACFDGQARARLRPPPRPADAGAAWAIEWQASGIGVIDPDRQAMLNSLTEQVQASLQRLAVQRALKRAERKSDEERLRAALLSSVSHDLKTPLVTMLGAATTLRDLGQDLSAADARDLLDSIISESRRLESYIRNLLDMTRLGHGSLSLCREWISLEEIYHVVIRRLARAWPGRHITLQARPGLPALHVHAALIEQALFNALENAIKAAGEAGEIVVRAAREGKTVAIRVCDQGPGLPRGQWEAVFDQFHTFSQGDRYEKGTGLGLSICRGIFRVHGGEARIVPPAAGFSHCLLMSLPTEEARLQSRVEP